MELDVKGGGTIHFALGQRLAPVGGPVHDIGAPDVRTKHRARLVHAQPGLTLPDDIGVAPLGNQCARDMYLGNRLNLPQLTDQLAHAINGVKVQLNWDDDVG